MDDDDHGAAAPRHSFRRAAEGFAELVATIPADAWEQPALGVWSVRELVGHASRALTTVEQYLGRTAEGSLVDGPIGYFVEVGADPPGSPERAARDEAIAERARQSAGALGDDPVGAVAALVGRVLALVDGWADDAPVASPAGPMTLVGYLPTRTLELAVHSLDLARATGLAVPEALSPAIAASLRLAVGIAVAGGGADTVLLALCGRGPLPVGFTLV